ncbi:MAG: SCO family protein [Pseudomonadota bacterium]|nr:SCO family protein [Pseudomonadota bacterium]
MNALKWVIAAVATAFGAVAQSHTALTPHPAPADSTDTQRSEAEYDIPNVTLVREDGTLVKLRAELNDGRPVVLNFVYTSCTTICPMSSQVFEQFQDEHGTNQASVHLVSISIDPEQDTPARLRAYAAKFHALKNWNHYSGSLAAVTAVQRAFNAYRGDKMSHVPLTLLRGAPGGPWVRLDGFARAEELVAEQKKWSAAPIPLVAR